MKNFKTLLLSALAVSLMVFTSCTKDAKEEVIVPDNHFTFTSGTTQFDYSKSVSGFTNVLKTYTIMAKQNDTVYVMMVIPSLAVGKYTNVSNKTDAEISFHSADEWYSSDYGVNATYTIEITSITDTYVEGTFTGKVGTIATSMGFESVYVDLNGRFGYKK